MKKLLMTAGAISFLVSGAVLAGGVDHHIKAPLSPTGYYVGVSGGAAFPSEQELNTGFLAGVHAGYSFANNFRLEGSFDFTKTNLNPSELNVPNSLRSYGTIVNTQAYSFLANAYYDFHLNQTVVPFIGAGIGWSYLTGNNSNFVKHGVKVSVTGNHVGAFTYQAIAGLGINLSNQLRLNIDYKYRGFDSIGLSAPHQNIVGASLDYYFK